MANRRMFAQSVIESDDFYSLTTDAQALYLHFCMKADDDGVVSSARTIIRAAAVGENATEELLQTGFILKPKTGSHYIIRHWRESNYIQSDRYKPTIFPEDFNGIDTSGNVYNMITDCIHVGYKMDTSIASVASKLSISEAKEINDSIGRELQEGNPNTNNDRINDAIRELATHTSKNNKEYTLNLVDIQGMTDHEKLSYLEEQIKKAEKRKKPGS